MKEPNGVHVHKFRKIWILKFLLFGALLLAVFGFVVMGLWNWLTPAMFGLRTIGYWQAVGLLILSKILFGGFMGRPRLHRGDRWGRWMADRWGAKVFRAILRCDSARSRRTARHQRRAGGRRRPSA